MATSDNTDAAFSIIAERSTTGDECWSCGDMRAAHFCSSCGKVQPATFTDFFSFFGLPRKLNLDTEELEREMYALSRKLHPDLYVRCSPQEQIWSLEQSSRLNDAYRTLKDPIERTEYLLKLEGVKLDEQSRLATDRARDTGEQKKQVVPADLLEEVFELNMQLEELKMNRKTGDVDAALKRDMDWARDRFEKRLKVIASQLKEFWNEWDALVDRQLSGERVSEDDRRKVRDKMVDLLNRRTYVRNLVRDITAALTD